MGKSRWLERLLHAEKERAERRTTENFFAYWWDGTKLREDVVRDVSSTGVFVCTPERWPKGKTVWMTLQRRGTLELNPDRRMTAQMKVMRPLSDGLGCMFVSVAQPEERGWEELVEHASTVLGVHDMEGYVKTMDAVAFLRQISGEPALLKLMREHLSSLRLKRAIELLQAAAGLVRGDEQVNQLRAQAAQVERILDAGTDGQEGELTKRWATLLARACTLEAADPTLPEMIETMGRLTDVPYKILEEACERARRNDMLTGPSCASKVTMTLAELMMLTDMREIPAQQSLQVLADHGLLELKERALEFKPEVKIDVTPTTLGLRTYAMTSRHRGTAEEFYQPFA